MLLGTYHCFAHLWVQVCYVTHCGLAAKKKKIDSRNIIVPLINMLFMPNLALCLTHGASSMGGLAWLYLGRYCD